MNVLEKKQASFRVKIETIPAISSNVAIDMYVDEPMFTYSTKTVVKYNGNFSMSSRNVSCFLHHKQK